MAEVRLGQGSKLMTTYALTDMQMGGTRAECHHENCWWWEDYETHDTAHQMLCSHMSTHRVKVSHRKAVATA